MLAGGYGSDTLTGGAGADRFVFDTALQARKNVDTLFDFDHADDTIELSHLIFGQSGKLGAIDADQLAIGPAATLPSHRIVYDSQAGTLAYDADGSLPGAAVVFATLVGAPSLDASDFFVV